MLSLLPPIPLYRRLLRAHRKFLPPDMRLVGDKYLKAEFRAHRNVANPIHIVCGRPPTFLPSGGGGFRLTRALPLQVGFLTEWQLYAQKIEGASWVGEKLEQAKFEKMSSQSSARDQDACGELALIGRLHVNSSADRPALPAYAGHKKPQLRSLTPFGVARCPSSFLPTSQKPRQSSLPVWR